MNDINANNSYNRKPLSPKEQKALLQVYYTTRDTLRHVLPFLILRLGYGLVHYIKCKFRNVDVCVKS